MTAGSESEGFLSADESGELVESELDIPCQVHISTLCTINKHTCTCTSNVNHSIGLCQNVS